MIDREDLMLTASANATIKQADAILLDSCRGDLARYQEIAEPEKALAAAEVGR